MVDALPPVLTRAALDDVGVDGSLRQVLHRAAVLGQLLRHREELLPELRADDAALLLGFGHVGQERRVTILGVHVYEIHVELLREHRLHFLGLVLAQKSVVHEHAGQLLADGAGAQRRHHGGVHAARKPQNHAVVSHLRAYRRHGVVDDRVHLPRRLKAADAEQEVLQQIVAAGGVAHLGMELRRVQPPLGHSIEATGHTSVAAVTAKPSGTRLTASRWLIHTVCSVGVPPYSKDGAVPSRPSRRVSGAGPYSPFSVCPTSPPA